MPQNQAPIPSDTTHKAPYAHPNCEGVTEQLRLSRQSMFGPETLAKLKDGFDIRQLVKKEPRKEAPRTIIRQRRILAGSESVFDFSQRIR